MKQREKKKFKKRETNLLDNYNQIHKRYRYWLGLFYLVVAINILVLQNYSAWKIVLRHNDTVLANTLANTFAEKLSQFDKSLDNIEIGKVIDSILLFKIPPTPWKDVPKNYKSKLKTLVRNRIKLLNDNELFSFQSIKIDTTKIDTFNILPIYAKYDSLINENRRSDKSISEKKNYVLEIKDEFNREIRSALGLDTSIDIDRIKREFFKKFKIDKKLEGITLSQLREILKSDLESYDRLMKDYLFTASNFGITFRGKYLVLISFFLIMILSFYLQLLYFTFKRYDDIYNLKGSNLELVSSFPNMLSMNNIRLPIPKILRGFVACCFNIVLPLIVALLFAFVYRSFLQDSKIFFLLFIYLILDIALLWLIFLKKGKKLA